MRQPFPHRNLHLIGILAWLSLAIFLFPNSLYQANWVLLIFAISSLIFSAPWRKNSATKRSFFAETPRDFFADCRRLFEQFFSGKKSLGYLADCSLFSSHHSTFFPVYLLPKNKENSISFWCQTCRLCLPPHRADVGTRRPLRLAAAWL